jgi:uncharacterized membrane protein HdeD (DUF308 family)
MSYILAHNWWALALRGLAALVFGTLVFFWPGITLVVLVLWFGAYALMDGLFAIIAAVKAAGRQQRWGSMLLEGVSGLGAGVLTFLWPGITALVLLYLIATWSILTGIFEIAAAIRLRREIEGEWLLGLGGIASIVFGVFLFAFPGVGALAVLGLIGAYALGIGILWLLLAFRLRRWRTSPSHEVMERRAA